MEKKLTPAMAQYYEMKAEYPEAILFFRMWDFYEMFDEDAHIAHRVLGINVTTRNKNAENPQPLAGIPYHAKDKYLPQLVNAGYKVAIAEQVSDPKAKWIVQREIVRVVTPATLNLEWESYNTKDVWNFIVSIVWKDDKYAISLLDPSSSKWEVWEIEWFEKLATILYKISPKEVILSKDLFWNEDLKNILSKKYSLNLFFYELKNNWAEILKQHFWVKNLAWFSLEDKPLACDAAWLVLDYLKWVQKTDLSYLERLSYNSFSDNLQLDESTIRSLDLLYNFSTNSSKLWTLFGVLDETKTSMWKRFLRDAIINPLQDIEKINIRLDIIEQFLYNPILLDKITTKLKQVADIDNILTRLALWRANPRDLLNLKNSLIVILEVFELIRQQGSNKLVRLLKLD